MEHGAFAGYVPMPWLPVGSFSATPKLAQAIVGRAWNRAVSVGLQRTYDDVQMGQLPVSLPG